MKTKRRLLMAGIVIGALFTLAPLVGLLGTVFGMTRAFKTLGSSGIVDPQALSNDIGITLYATAAGVFLFPVGITIFVVSLVFFLRLRASTPPPLPQPPSSADASRP